MTYEDKMLAADGNLIVILFNENEHNVLQKFALSHRSFHA